MNIVKGVSSHNEIFVMGRCFSFYSENVHGHRWENNRQKNKKNLCIKKLLNTENT